MLSVAVQHQLCSLAEYSFASRAEDGMLPCVELHVSFQLFTGDEAFATNTAGVRLLSSVNFHVHGKVERVRETLSTLDTNIWLAFHMLLLMDLQ